MLLGNHLGILTFISDLADLVCQYVHVDGLITLSFLTSVVRITCSKLSGISVVPGFKSLKIDQVYYL